MSVELTPDDLLDLAQRYRVIRKHSMIVDFDIGLIYVPTNVFDNDGDEILHNEWFTPGSDEEEVQAIINCANAVKRGIFS